MGVPWPSSVWLDRIRAQAVVPGQVLRRSRGAKPHNPRPPIWLFETRIRNWKTREAGLFMNSLGGASQIVDLPMAGPDVVMPLDNAYAEDGEWGVSLAELGVQYTEVTIVNRPGVDHPPAGAMILVGSADDTRLYEVRERNGLVLNLNPRVEPPTGTTRLFRASSVPVRLDTSRNPVWGVRDLNVAGGYPGGTYYWFEA